MEEKGEDMNEETAVGDGVCSHGSQAYRVGTYVYDASCCKFMYTHIKSLSFFPLPGCRKDRPGGSTVMYSIYAPTKLCRVVHQM